MLLAPLLLAGLLLLLGLSSLLGLVELQVAPLLRPAAGTEKEELEALLQYAWPSMSWKKGAWPPPALVKECPKKPAANCSSTRPNTGLTTGRHTQAWLSHVDCPSGRVAVHADMLGWDVRCWPGGWVREVPVYCDCVHTRIVRAPSSK
jgi:hypothetical protein